MKRIATAALAAAVLLPAGARAQRIDTMEIRSSTYFLASDLLLGRDTGSPGSHVAALYLSSELQRLGLKPVGADGSYLLPVPLKAARLDNLGTRLVVRRGADTVAFASGRDFVVNQGGATAFHDFTGDAVLVGSAEEADHAVPSGSLQGKVLVVLGGLGAEARRLVPDWSRRGAAGIVTLVPDEESLQQFIRSRGDVRYYIDAPVEDAVWEPALPSIIAGPAIVRVLLAGAVIPDSVLRGKALDHAVPLGRAIAATIRTQVSAVAAADVAGLVPGRDPARRDEVVVFTAHYDHLGISTPNARRDSIYNGFSDNAAGDGMLLAIAGAMIKDPPARSVLFLFPTGEERGLLGSTYYATHPAIPLARTIAEINLDAGAPPAPPTSWAFAGGTTSGLGQLASRIVQGHGWKSVLGAASPNSDYWPFLQRGVPAIFIKPGPDWEGVGPEEKKALLARWEHYHDPADEWSPDFPFRGLQRYAEVGLELGRAVADAPARPTLAASP